MKTAKKLLASAMAIIMALSAASCGKSDSSADDIIPKAEPVSAGATFEKTEGKLDEQFLANASDFTVELLKKAAKDDLKEGRNVMVSPESVMMALGMTANGSGGKTLEDFQKLLGGGMKLEDLNRNLSLLISKAKSEQDIKFGIANSIWVREGDRITLEPSFADICKKRLDAESFVAPFNDDTLSKLNGWVKENTNGMIDSILDRFTEYDVAVLINCIAFEAEWEDQYEDDDILDDIIFTNSKGKEEKCSLLCSTEKEYITDGKAEGFLRYYKGGKYAFAALLPNEGMTAEEYIDTLTGDGLRRMLSERSTAYDVYAKIPEFKFDWGGSIADSLKAMGIESAFREDADFSNMAKTQSGALSISDVIHKTHIELDRKGTKAAAVTAVTMTDNACIAEPEPYKDITLDRPFVMMIIDTETNMPLFIGAVNTLED